MPESVLPEQSTRADAIRQDRSTPILISPTEPKLLRDAGTVSLVPENYGCDVLVYSPDYGPVGIQRKEIKDLVASVRDGRLGRQLVLMKQLNLAVVLLEGRGKWTQDGSLITSSRHGTPWTLTQHHGVLWSIQSRGVWVASTDSLNETIAWLSLFQKWCAKPRKTSSLESRPKGKDEFGKDVQGRDFGIHLLQSFPRVGREVAGTVVDYFGGVPLQWTVTPEELREVPGIGLGTAKKLVGMLDPNQPPTTQPSTRTDPFPQSGKGRDSSGKGSSNSTSSTRTAKNKAGTSPTQTTSPSIDDWITIEEVTKGT